MPSFFKPNPKGFQELEADPKFQGGLAGETERAVTAAKALAPVAEGDYRNSIRVVKDGKAVYLSAFDYKAWWIEAGTVDTPIFAPLRRGAQAAGLKFKAKRK